jgi:hypothetical protein
MKSKTQQSEQNKPQQNELRHRGERGKEEGEKSDYLLPPTFYLLPSALLGKQA